MTAARDTRPARVDPGPRRADLGSRPSAALVVVSGGVAVCMLVPIGYVVSVVVDVGWSTLSELIFRPRVGELLRNTVALVLIAVPATVVLGVGGAWLVERTSLPGRRAWAIVL